MDVFTTVRLDLNRFSLSLARMRHVSKYTDPRQSGRTIHLLLTAMIRIFPKLTITDGKLTGRMSHWGALLTVISIKSSVEDVNTSISELLTRLTSHTPESVLRS